MVKQIAIIGGGMAGLACAYALSGTPSLRRRFQVTIYERSWLLGGKGASARGSEGRIEEHGLHVVMGHYHHVLALLRSCYRELDRPPHAPLARFEQALAPLERIVMGAEGNEGAADGSGWEFWPCEFPPQAGPASSAELPTRALAAITAMLGGNERSGARASLAGIGQWLVNDGRTERARQLREFLLVLARGMTRDRVIRRGFESIDGEDLRAWFARHGASAELLTSPLLRVIYDVLFARLDGDPSRERIAAGTALRFGLRMLLDYDGGFFWLMQAGMGEVVFAPLYQVLRRRGVGVRFFHALDDVRLSRDGRTLEALTLRRLATPIGAYEPLVEVDGLPCWRASPDPDQLVEGPALRRLAPSFNRPIDDWPGEARVTLERGRHFDAAVLAIPPPALRPLLEARLPVLPRLATMFDAVPTNGTLACQLWLRRPLSELGCGPEPFALTSFADPMATVADMSHLLAVEGHPATVRGLLYLTSSLPPALERANSREALRDALRDWLETHGPALLPGAVDEDGGFDWTVLHDPLERRGPARLDAQYLRVNAHGSERYTLAPPGGSAGRLRADESGIAGMYFAGDWTRNGLDCGCLEAAARSGEQSAAAIRAAYRSTRSVLARARTLPR